MFGHVNISVNKTMFDFTGSGFKYHELSKYLLKQKRKADVIVLDLSITQELLLIYKILKHNLDQDYGLLMDVKSHEWRDYTCIDSVRKPLYELYNEDSKSIYNFPKTTKDGVKFPSDFLMELIDSQIKIEEFQYFEPF